MTRLLTIRYITLRLQERQRYLRKILQDQIRIAQTLTQIDGKYNRSAIYAWDVVEEISKKLSILKTRIYEEENNFERDPIEYDIELSERVYDI